MNQTNRTGVLLCAIAVLLPCTVNAQEPPQTILKKAAARLANAKTYQYSGTLHVSSDKMGQASMHMMAFVAGTKYRLTFVPEAGATGKLATLSPDNPLLMVHNGSRTYYTVKGVTSYTQQDSEGIDFLPPARDIDILPLTLLPSQTLQATKVYPVCQKADDEATTTYFIAQGTYRLLKVEYVSHREPKATFVALFQRERLNIPLSARLFTFAAADRNKAHSADLPGGSPLALLFIGMEPAPKK